MVTKFDIILFSFIGLLCLLSIIFWSDLKAAVNGKETRQEASNKKDKKKDKKDDKKDKEDIQGIEEGISVTQRWEMPGRLKEISGLATIDETYLACVQDEAGMIFIFNTATGKLHKEISFGGAGDYEGISIVGSNAWVIRSDGKLFEVQEYNSVKPVVKEHVTGLTSKQNVEGICYDERNNRLLIAIKGKEQNSNSYKGIYAFNLTTKKMAAAPVHKINLTHEIWNNVKGKDKMQPSGLDVHPVTGDLYILDGPSSRLLVMSPDGKDQKLYQLSNSDFPQPEGITFTPSAQLYVANEGRKTGIGNILKLSVND